MKLFGAVLVAALAVGPLSAQYWSVGGFGNVAFPGGHAPARANPWGNVTSPAIPQGAAAFSAGAVAGNRYGSPFSGFSSGRGTGHGSRRGNTSGIYVYPVYIGGYGYPYGYGNGYEGAQPDQSPNGTADNPPAQPPVVINQYFGPASADQGPPPEAADSNFRYYQAPSNDDTAAPGDTSYYLIAFKDHTVYSAVAYYTEGDTLHYFTSGNVHNQVSLSLVDRPLTEQLNRQRNVAVRLPQ